MKKAVKIISLLMAVMLFVTTFTSTDISAASNADEIRNEINSLEQRSQELEARIKSLKVKINEQIKLKNAIDD